MQHRILAAHAVRLLRLKPQHMLWASGDAAAAAGATVDVDDGQG